MSRKGFTLVELSIVLVIIGLLIGGILAAQSMIETAKVGNYIRKLQLYEIAVSNFKSNYKQEPGDSTYFTPSGNGDGNHSIIVTCKGIYSGQEDTQVWAHLSQAKMLDKNYVPFDPITCGGTNDGSLPKMLDITTPVFSEDDRFMTGWMSSTKKQGIAYHVETYRHYTVTLPAVTAIAADLKMDDGKSATGSMILSRDSDNCEQVVAANNSLKTEVCNVFWYPDGISDATVADYP